MELIFLFWIGNLINVLFMVWESPIIIASNPGYFNRPGLEARNHLTTSLLREGGLSCIYYWLLWQLITSCKTPFPVNHTHAIKPQTWRYSTKVIFNLRLKFNPSPFKKIQNKFFNIVNHTLKWLITISYRYSADPRGYIDTIIVT